MGKRWNLERKLLILISGVLVASLLAFWWVEYRHIKADAETELLSSADRIRDVLMATRRVYQHQFIDSGLPLNKKTIGFLPAHAMGEISNDLSNWSSDGFSFNNVSDNPRNPLHKADALEEEAIAFFRNKPEEEFHFVPYENEKGELNYHYARPIWVEQYCLKCHGDKDNAPVTIQESYDEAYDYKLGELRGVLSIKIPASNMESRIRQQVYLQLYLKSALILLIGLLIGWTVRRQVTEPLSNIAAAARRIGSGQLDTLIDIRASSDFEELAHDLSHMASQLQVDKDSLVSERSFLKALIKTIPDLVWMKDPDGFYLLCNDRFEQFFGHPEHEVVGKTDYDFVNRELADLFRENDMAAIRNGGPRINTEEVVFADDGHRERIETIKTPIFNIKGELVGVLGIGRDITRQHQAEAVLRDERDEKQRYLDTMQTIMVALDNRGDISMINRAGRELLGYEKEELIGRNWFDCCLPEPDGMELVYPIFLKIMAGEVVQNDHFENSVICRDGSERMISWYSAELTNEAGEVIGLLSSGEDVTETREAEVLIKEEQQRYHEIFNATSEAIFIHDATTGKIIDVNNRMLEMYGLERSEALRLSAEASSSGTPPYTEENAHEKVRLTVVEGPQTFEWHARHNDGSLFWVEVSTRASYIGDKRRVLAVVRDISARKALEEQMNALAKHNRLILDSSGEGIFGLDSEGRHAFVNPAAAEMLGYSAEELIGQPSHAIWHHHHPDGDDYPAQECPIRETGISGVPHSGEEWFIKRGGDFFPVSYSSSPIVEDERITGVVVSFSDISEKKKADEKIHYLAYYDELTALPNRALMIDRVTQQLATAQRLNNKATLVLLNIDRFTNINTARGHNMGDFLLVALARRLEQHLYKEDTLARLSADEFAVLLPHLNKSRESEQRNAIAVVDKLQAVVRDPLLVGDEAVNITVSMGATLFPESASDQPRDILRRADSALHRAKRAGGNQCAFFERGMDEVVQRHYQIERELYHAVNNAELRIFLQAQVDADGVLVAAETLVRWEHPERGLIPPGVFIPIAEESDLIVDVGGWVLTEAMHLMARCDMAGHQLKLSVNLSPRQFRKQGFVPWFKGLVNESGADPTNLTLEVTEGLFIDDLSDVVAKMDELVAMGVNFSIDDFGTGYSSLSYLKRLPINELKIDKSFVQDAPHSADDAALVETILLVAKSMRLKVVAEGVEKQEQADFLNARSEVIHQGYLYGKPEQAEIWIDRWFNAD
ncbi:hypothetical protein BOW53_08615 [Solemya pervernicosa gill symbiont]|uniref:Sensor domain-containing diguanylate cyclase n=2 Tax=Gammaproteobacteria incertae sedis TaxID=118884 RepID=A0A1T2L581_9GAMM|nr:PAS domain S-box protein [Candidatus Reidiella endopervernicosa]OOZ40221.1 hypothetical protein BOW53_08615 [Solemya pervernicosa gill symbiont]QKQ27122.1 PAS domain S-box protein [Candidatus Reidiella endopervernicosa]